jgi:hypothetical protein
VTAAVFDDFQNESISSWISSAFTFFENVASRSASPLRLGKATKGLDFLGFITAGAQRALSVGHKDSVSKQSQTITLDASSAAIDEALNFTLAPQEELSATLPASESLSPPTLRDAAGVMEYLSGATKEALGIQGTQRLLSFAELGAGWDGGSGNLLQLSSLARMDEFFGSYDIRPAGLGVFMSQDGDLIVNWLDAQGFIVELEFSSSKVAAFFEATEESMVMEKIDSRLIERLSKTGNVH